MGKTKKVKRVVKGSEPKVPEIEAQEISWKFTYQQVPDGQPCPHGLEFVVNFTTGKNKARIPNPWRLTVWNPKSKKHFKVEVGKDDTPASVMDSLQAQVGIVSICLQSFKRTN